MLIKSHTGNMVDARVGMVVVYRSPIDPPETKFTICEIEDSSCGDCLRDTEKTSYASGCCTMLSCPFVVGDEVEQKVVDLWQKQAAINCIDRHGIWVGQRPEVLVEAHKLRHASPDLRDAPGYKP